MLFFFFQAEDGIRDLTVTGVQTCALPICSLRPIRCTSTRSPTSRAMWSTCRSAISHADRKSVVWGKSVDLGGCRIIKKKDQTTFALLLFVQPTPLLRGLFALCVKTTRFEV